MSIMSDHATKLTALTVPSNPWAKQNKTVLSMFSSLGYRRLSFRPAASFFEGYAESTVKAYASILGLRGCSAKGMSEQYTDKARKLGYTVTDSTGVEFIPRSLDVIRAVGSGTKLADLTKASLHSLAATREYYETHEHKQREYDKSELERFERAEGMWSAAADTELRYDVFGEKLTRRQSKALDADLSRMDRPQLYAVLNDLQEVHSIEARRKCAKAIKLLDTISC